MSVPRKSVRVRAPVSVATTAMAVMTIAWMAPSAAWATDGFPCGDDRRVGGRMVQYCPLWTSQVPVRETAAPDARIVDWLWYGGSSNWFTYQCVGRRQQLGNYYNGWWARTLGDHGRWGYVSEVYFKGGDNNERDGALHTRAGYTCNGG